MTVLCKKKGKATKPTLPMILINLKAEWLNSALTLAKFPIKARHAIKAFSIGHSYILF